GRRHGRLRRGTPLHSGDLFKLEPGVLDLRVEPVLRRLRSGVLLQLPPLLRVSSCRKALSCEWRLVAPSERLHALPRLSVGSGPLRPGSLPSRALVARSFRTTLVAHPRLSIREAVE